MGNSNEYMKNYMRERWTKRQKAAREYLGGKCVRCSTTEELQFHHIDPSTKLFTIARRTSASEEKFWAEIDKCQLLCYTCHVDEHRQKEHGTLTMYRYCKCDLCVEAKTVWQREYGRRVQGKKPRVLAEHGTRARYLKECRCKECRAANTAYSAELKQRKISALGVNG